MAKKNKEKHHRADAGGQDELTRRASSPTGSHPDQTFSSGMDREAIRLQFMKLVASARAKARRESKRMMSKK